MSDEVFAFSYNSFMRALMTLMLAGPKHSSVVLTADTLRVRMGLGGWIFAADVPRSSITGATSANRKVAGWGAHGFAGRWLVNGSSQGLVDVTIDPKGRGRVNFVPVKLKRLTLSLEQPDELIARLPAAAASG